MFIGINPVLIVCSRFTAVTFQRRVNAAVRHINKRRCCAHPRLQPIRMAYNSYENTYATDGDDCPLVIMHGLFGSKNNWNSLSKAIHIQTNKKVIAVDARNHGDSPHTDEFSYFHLTEDINLFSETMGFPKGNYLGHSMGGRAMMMFALSHPQKVNKLVVVDISPVQSSLSLFKMHRYFDAFKSVNLNSDLSMSVARKQADEQLRSQIDDAAVRQFLLTNLIKTQDGFKWKLNVDVLARTFEENLTRFPSTTAKCDCPVLFIGGTKSDYLKCSDHDHIVQFFPNADFVYLNTGHWVHAEKPREFVDIVVKFLQDGEQ